jgi:poly(A) polymerase
MREIWMMQPRFERRSGTAPFALVDQPRFRAGYDFLRLRADAGEVDGELADWWEDFSLGTQEEREALLQAARETSHARRGEGDAAAAKKKRRRRRKPAGDAAGAPPSAEP